MRITATLFLLVTAAVICPAQTTSELNFLSGQSDGRALRQMLPDWLKAKAFRMLDGRKAETGRITSSQQVFDRRRVLREKMTRGLGGFPERTPLNARVTGVLDRGDYRVEKVIFESQPGFHVTANLYVPARGQGPFPAILFPLGHEQPGAKAYTLWQHLLISFAKKGYVALAWDTIGQGERIQLWDEDFQASKVIRSTTEHTIIGLQCLLAGDALAMYTIWDGIRALDYLLSRPEVDPKRIGVTGNSGGGTHTSYLAAMDDRIHVAAPSCYLTSWRRLLETIGPQDAEQCIPPWIADGLDHADFVISFAPKPFMILSAIRDFFSIAGARETFAESQRIYDSIGAGEKVAMVEADDGHGYSLPRREAAYGWFGKWLKGMADDSAEPELKVDMEEDLLATATGQVATSLNSETVFTLNQKRVEKNRQTGASLATVKRMLSYEPSRAPLNVKPYGRLSRQGYRIEKLVYESEPGILIPALVYVPDGDGRRAAVVIADGQGKSAANAVAEAVAKSGRVALSVDLRGLGETRTSDDRNGSDWPRYFGDYSSAMTALLTGKPLVAMRAEDISRAVDLLAARADVDAGTISVYGRDLAAVPALYAAALDSRISSATLERMLVSYDSVIRHRIHRNIWENAVQGALRHYDLPDLAKWMGPRKVQLIDAVDPLGETLSLEKVRAAYGEAALTRRKPGDPVLNWRGE
jgi:cephalosporin-C deacetylase-like acetyl esterase